jgi:hypothetical protein
MPERESTRYEAVLSLSIEAADRSEAVDWMVDTLRQFGEQVKPEDFGIEGDDEDSDVVAVVPNVASDDDPELGSLSFWCGTVGPEGEVNSLEGIFKMIWTYERDEAGNGAERPPGTDGSRGDA